MPSTRPDEQPDPYNLEEDHPGLSRRDRRKSPQPWVVRKLTIAIAGAIIAYTAYVYIGRLCIPMIKHRSGSSLGSRTLGSECQCLTDLLIPSSLPSLSPTLADRLSHFFFFGGSCVFGCFCGDGDHHDLGVYQGACFQPPVAWHSPSSPLPPPTLPLLGVCVYMCVCVNLRLDLNGPGRLHSARLCDRGERRLSVTLPCFHTSWKLYPPLFRAPYYPRFIPPALLNRVSVVRCDGAAPFRGVPGPSDWVSLLLSFTPRAPPCGADLWRAKMRRSSVSATSLPSFLTDRCTVAMRVLLTTVPDDMSGLM